MNEVKIETVNDYMLYVKRVIRKYVKDEKKHEAIEKELMQAFMHGIVFSQGKLILGVE